MEKDMSKRRFYDDPCARLVKCSDCKNREMMSKSCKAFPDGIPVTHIRNLDAIAGECNNGYGYEKRK